MPSAAVRRDGPSNDTEPIIAAGIVLLFVGVVYPAQITGHWHSRRTPREFRMGLMMMEPSRLHHSAARAGKQP
ncbi:MAG: hypothetical protein JJV98_19900 [Desulfosarcina sp.]|nr:hypothetical protein [Desulfobacterales bacterium]